MTAVDNLFSGGARMVHEEAIELTLASLRAYWDRHEHISIAWSGGKDSTALVTLVVHLIEAGDLPQPKKLRVYYADTRQEMPPIQIAALLIIEKLRQRDWVEVIVVTAPLDKRFMVYMLGRGVPPPNNGTLRWCTRQIKVDPMATALEAALTDLEGSALMLTGVREGESAQRDGRITMSCSKDGAECGQGWYQQVLPNAKGIRGRLATLAPLLHWRVCIVWDWLKVFAPQPEFGGWPTAILADAYGGDDATEIAARTGCICCPLVDHDTALSIIVAMPHWAYLAPLLELRAVYRWLREDDHIRLRKPGGERLKGGELAANQQRKGPTVLDARWRALKMVLSIQARVNAAAARLGRPTVDILNGEEKRRIVELITSRTWPDDWSGDEPRADVWLDAHYNDGSVQPILFRELVGQ